jgi:hypothetical protein
MGIIAKLTRTEVKPMEDKVPTLKFDGRAVVESFSQEAPWLLEGEQLQRQINEAHEKLRAFDAHKQKLAAKKQLRLQRAASAIIDGTKADVAALDAEIATLEREQPAHEREAAAINVAINTLSERQRSQQLLAESVRHAGLRSRMRELEAHLDAVAPLYVALVKQLRDAATELAAVTMARNRIAPKIAGSSQLDGMAAGFSIPAPSLKAFDGIAGSVDLRRQAEVRMREILNDLGVRA